MIMCRPLKYSKQSLVAWMHRKNWFGSAEGGTYRLERRSITIAIITITASKATPRKVLDYITNELKASKIGSWNLDPNRDACQQMQETAKLWNKCKEKTSRKYYHLKLSFNPDDWYQKKLTEADALEIGMDIVMRFFPSAECVLAVHVDKEHLHVHAVINAVNPLTGKMVNMRAAQYRELKDYTQEICQKRGLTSIDWRAASKAKREQERTEGPVVRESFAEQRMQLDGKIPIKTKLRAIINECLMTATSFEEFRENLEKRDVTLTRATSNTISYRLSTYRPYRGDTLGQAFTMRAIRVQIAHNQKNGGINKKIREAATKAAQKHVLTEEEQLTIRNLGQYLGLSREEVERLFESAINPSKQSKQHAWNCWKTTKEQFWSDYRERKQYINAQIDALYRARTSVKNAEWLLQQAGAKMCLWGWLYALILKLTNNKSLQEIDEEIACYKAVRRNLQRNVEQFKNSSRKGVQSIKTPGFSVDEYASAILKMHTSADLAFYAVLDIPLSRQYVIGEDRMISKEELLILKKDFKDERS